MSEGRHIHIVGCSPRSGTTLMQEMMVTCFAIDDYCEHERSIFKSPVSPSGVLCTKHPREVMYMDCVLRHNPNVYVIYVGRDPRDVIVSQHKQRPGEYFSNLRIWKESDRDAQHLAGHPRFLAIRYEDLVNSPDEVQIRIKERMPFLKQLHPFSAFHLHAKVSEQSAQALNGLRPLDPSSIGRWRQHLQRVASQIRVHGDISSRLVELGYESDDSWMKQLPSADRSEESVIPEKLSLFEKVRMKWRIKRKCINYFFKTHSRFQ